MDSIAIELPIGIVFDQWQLQFLTQISHFSFVMNALCDFTSWVSNERKIRGTMQRVRKPDLNKIRIRH